MNCKRPRGRRPIYGVAGVRCQVKLPALVVEELRRIGDGSLTRGIVEAHNQLKVLQEWRTRHVGSR